MTVEEAKKTAKEMLSGERFHHTTCVAKSARALAVRYGEDPDRAEIAGYLHDIAKEMPKADLLQMIERSAIIDKPSAERELSAKPTIAQQSGALSKPDEDGKETINLGEIRHCKPVWHAYAGGIYAKEQLGCDDEIADAVSHHTTGRAGMTKLEKIVFLADYISEDRDFKNLEDIRKLAFVSLDEAIVEVIARQVKHLMKHKKYVDLNTVRAYNDLIVKQADEK